MASSTIEHCPPRAMFQFRQWPEGFEFPACKSCNSGTSDHDLLIAMLARMDPFEEKGNLDGSLVGLMKQANRQFPGLFEKMRLSAAEARQSNRVLGIQLEAGQTQQETGVIRVPEEFHEAVCRLALKLSKGIFYRESGNFFPNDGCLILNWFTNADFMRDEKYVILDLLRDMGGVVPPVTRSGKYLNEQFVYKLSMSPEFDFILVQAMFGNAFGLVTIGSALPGRLEEIIARLREKTGNSGPFSILQTIGS